MTGLEGNQEVKKGDDNVVFIGKKSTMSYVFSVQTQAQTQTEVSIKARGRSMSKAIDVSLIALHRFLNGWELGEINIDTEEKNNNENGRDRVSVVEIFIKKKGI